MSRILSIALVGAALARAAFGDAASFEWSARNYVQDGLVGLYDAVENAGWDTHDAEATSWKNLVGTSVMGDLDVTNLKSHSWGDAALTLSSGWDKISPDGMLVTDESVALSKFTIETAVRTPADGMVRRWEAFPWTASFETWTSSNSGECYMERINGTRISACRTRMKNVEMSFSTVYDSLRHVARAFADGVEYVTNAMVANFTYSGRLAFFSSMNNAQGHVIRVYNRALSAEEVRLNNVVDQLRFQGKTVETVALPDGWAFDSAGVLRTASGKVLLRPDGAAGRAIVSAAYATAGGSVVCTVGFEEGVDGVTNALYLAWGDEDMGEDVRDWPQVRRVANVPPDVTELEFVVPPACVAYGPSTATRLFLGESVRPYDYRISAVGAKGAQYLVTDYYANPKTVVDCDVELFDLTLQQRPFGADSDYVTNAFSCSVYVNGSGMWAFASQDGAGQWQWTACAANSERTRLHLDVANGVLTVCSPTYAGWKTNTSVKRTKTSTVPLGLCCSNRGGIQNLLLQNAFFYRATISEDGEVLRDYVPCVAGGRAALYDAVGDVVRFSSSGTDFLESGANVDAGVTQGETPATSFAAGTIPQSLFVVDTESTPRTIDAQLVYTDGGRKFGRAPLVLANAGNDFGGTFTVEEGALAASFGAGLAATDHLALNGGLWALAGGTTVATIGVGAGEVSLTGDRAGFGAYGGDATLKVLQGGSDGVVYPSEDFSPARLVFNDAYCTKTLSFDSPISVADDSTTLPIEVGGGTAALLKSVDARVMTKTGMGRLEFAAAGNSVSNFAVSTGAAALMPGSEMELRGKLDVTAPSGTFEARDATLSGMNAVLVSQSGGSRTVTFDGATVEIQRLQVGKGQTGRVVVTNGASVMLKQFDGCTGNVWQYGGTVCTTNNATGDVNFGCWGNCTFNYYLYGGTFERVKAGGNFQLGRAEKGVANMYVEREGRLVTHCEYPSIGRAQGSTGRLYVRNGGRVAFDYTAGAKIAKMCVADEGTGYLEIASGGEVDVAGWVQMANDYGTTDLHKAREGEVRLLAGGTLKARGLVRNDTGHRRTTLVFDGGRWVVNGTPEKPFISRYLTEAFVGTSGGVFDTNGHDVEFARSFEAWSGQTWTQPATAAEIASCAAFTKTGEGTLTFNAANTYAAATCVSNGTLATAAAGALPSEGLLKLAGGAVDLKATEQTAAMLAGFGTVANGSLSVTGSVWPGLGAEGGTLALNATSAAFTKLNYSLAKGADGQVVCGRLTSDGAVDLSGVEISVDGLENMGERQVVLVEAAAISGRPTCALPSPFSLVKSATRLSLSPMTGTLLIFR